MFFSRLRFIPCLFLCLCLAAPARADEDRAPSDAGSFAVFNQLNSLEIALSRAAAEMARREEVRTLARLIVGDQETQQREGHELGRRLKIFAGPPRDELGSYAVTVDRLKSMPAGEFDRAYLKQVAVVERNAIDALSRQLPTIRDPAVAAFLGEVVRNFERHREAVEVASLRLGGE